MDNNAFEILRKLKQEGEIGLVEYEFAGFLYRADPSINQNLLFLSVVVIHDQQKGNICTDLNELENSELAKLLGISELKINEVYDLIKDSEIIGKPGDYLPLIIEENRIYLHKYWSYEQELVIWLQGRVKALSEIKKKDFVKATKDLKHSKNETDYQDIAVALSFLSDFLIISGGPGTGKTYTIQKIVESLLSVNSDLSIAMAAPTGKAAERLNFKVSEEKVIQGITIHRLLGARKNGEFSYGKERKLPYDVIIVDEASMLDIRLWIGLVRAIKEKTKLILLGDKDQLSSVEAGSVLGDICNGSVNTFSNSVKDLLNASGYEVQTGESQNMINDHIILFKKSYRAKEFSGINEFAHAINDQNEKLLREVESKFESIKISEPSSELLKEIVELYSTDLTNKQLNTQIICSNKHGVFGTIALNKLIEQNIRKKMNISGDAEWYNGKRVLIAQNDYSNNLSNGEIGTCSVINSEIKINFSDNRSFYPDQLKHYDLAYAITVHKSQGSEFDHVTLCLSDKINPALSKELLYTGVTRARFSTHVIGYRKVFEYTFKNEGKRSSGLSEKILKKAFK